MKKDDFYERENEHIEGKERMATMKGKEKWQYFKSYYLVKSIFFLALVIIVVLIIMERVQASNDIYLYGAVIEEELNEQTEVLSEEYVSYLNSEKYDISLFIDHAYVADTAVLNTKIGIGGVDFLIAEDEFHTSYQPGNFADLETLLTEKMLEKVENYLLYSVDEEGNEYAYGVDLISCEKYQETDPTVEHPIISIPIDSKNKELVADFIEFLWEE